MRVRDESFKQFVLDQLGQLQGLACRAMFGGHGLYQRDDFFGILWQGRLYLKTDARTLARYRARGMKPFRPSARQTLTSYYEVPVDVLEDAEQLTEWAQAAIAAQPGSHASSRRGRAVPLATRVTQKRGRSPSRISS